MALDILTPSPGAPLLSHASLGKLPNSSNGSFPSGNRCLIPALWDTVIVTVWKWLVWTGTNWALNNGSCLFLPSLSSTCTSSLGQKNPSQAAQNHFLIHMIRINFLQTTIFSVPYDLNSPQQNKCNFSATQRHSV